MKKILLISSLFLLAGCASGTTISNENTTPNKGVIEVDQKEVDLKDIPIFGGTKEILFSFWNAGPEPVTLLEGVTSCMCTTAVVEKGETISERIEMAGHKIPAKINQILKSGEEATLRVTFDPLAHGPNATGPMMREITLQTNSSETPVVKFRFLGNVVKK